MQRTSPIIKLGDCLIANGKGNIRYIKNQSLLQSFDFKEKIPMKREMG